MKVSRLRNDAAFAGRDLEGGDRGATARACSSMVLWSRARAASSHCHAHVSVQLYTRERDEACDTSLVCDCATRSLNSMMQEFMLN